MLKGFTHARLACGCRIAFREGVEGSPVTVVIDQKSPGCTLSLHVRDLPLFDYREALRPSTRLGPREEEEFEEEVYPPLRCLAFSCGVNEPRRSVLRMFSRKLLPTANF